MLYLFESKKFPKKKIWKYFNRKFSDQSEMLSDYLVNKDSDGKTEQKHIKWNNQRRSRERKKFISQWLSFETDSYLRMNLYIWSFFGIYKLTEIKEIILMNSFPFNLMFQNLFLVHLFPFRSCWKQFKVKFV